MVKYSFALIRPSCKLVPPDAFPNKLVASASCSKPRFFVAVLAKVTKATFELVRLLSNVLVNVCAPATALFHFVILLQLP